MIDLSLTKLALIGVVALVVIGPEKLPKLARMAGTLLGRAQRYINDVKSEVSRDMALDELHSLKRDVQEAAQDIESSLAQFRSDAEASTENTSKLSHPTDEQFAAKAKEFRRLKMARSLPLAQQHRQRRKSRAGLRTGASCMATGQSTGSFF